VLKQSVVRLQRSLRVSERVRNVRGVPARCDRMKVIYFELAIRSRISIQPSGISPQASARLALADRQFESAQCAAALDRFAHSAARQ
jgi:hypothetical protein